MLTPQIFHKLPSSKTFNYFNIIDWIALFLFIFFTRRTNKIRLSQIDYANHNIQNGRQVMVSNNLKLFAKSSGFRS